MVAPVQWLHYNSPMPTISRLQSCTLTMYELITSRRTSMSGCVMVGKL